MEAAVDRTCKQHADKLSKQMKVGCLKTFCLLVCFIIIIIIIIIGERAKRARHSQVCTIENRGYIMVRAISVYSAGVPYAARFTAAVKIPLPSATFQF